jgi:hypothetical protein
MTNSFSVIRKITPLLFRNNISAMYNTTLFVMLSPIHRFDV